MQLLCQSDDFDARIIILSWKCKIYVNILMFYFYIKNGILISKCKFCIRSTSFVLKMWFLYGECRIYAEKDEIHVKMWTFMSKYDYFDNGNTKGYAENDKIWYFWKHNEEFMWKILSFT